MSGPMLDGLPPTTPLDDVPRPVLPAMLRGWRGRCPACGRGAIFRAFLKVSDHCPACGEALHHHRADDAPPYFTMLIVGHIVGSGILITEMTWHPATWVHWVTWIPMLILLSLVLLPRIKGALIGLQWALRMHGFGSAGPHLRPMPGNN